MFSRTVDNPEIFSRPPGDLEQIIRECSVEQGIFSKTRGLQQDRVIFSRSSQYTIRGSTVGCHWSFSRRHSWMLFKGSSVEQQFLLVCIAPVVSAVNQHLINLLDELSAVHWHGFQVQHCLHHLWSACTEDKHEPQEWHIGNQCYCDCFLCDKISIRF